MIRMSRPTPCARHSGGIEIVPALIIFVITYLIIVLQKIPGLHLSRAAGALVGAVAMGVFGVLTVPEIYAAIDLDTITFLLGVMILTSYLEMAGFFTIVERLIVSRARTGSALLAMVVASSGLLAPLFMNDTVCMMMTPVLLRIATRLRVPPAPYLIAMVTATNIGSVMTVVGNPQNMLIGIRSHIPFLDFAGRLWPVAAVGLCIDYAVIRWSYRRTLPGRLSDPKPVGSSSVPQLRLALSLVVMLAFLVLLAAGFPPPTVAMSLGALVILLESHRPSQLLQQVDWTLLLLFAGLFIVMHGVEQAGVIDRIIRAVGGFVSAEGGAGLTAMALAAVLASNLVSNVPAVLLLSPMLITAGATDRGWLTLAMSSTLAGNLTVIGSAANLIVFEMARRSGIGVSVTDYLKIGVPVTLFSLVFGWWILTLS
jgi:Na+/H+ antiporter NhaD/arsenite permease-like protein